MNAKYLGRGCAIDSSIARAASSSASWTLTGSSGRPSAQDRSEPLVERRLLRPRPVEAPPGLRHQLRDVLERLLARRVEP